MHGVPIVASACEALEELLAHGNLGRLAPVGDTQKLSAMIIELLQNPEEAIAMGQRAAEAARSSYLWPERIREIKKIYEALTSLK